MKSVNKSNNTKRSYSKKASQPIRARSVIKQPKFRAMLGATMFGAFASLALMLAFIAPTIKTNATAAASHGVVSFRDASTTIGAPSSCVGSSLSIPTKPKTSVASVTAAITTPTFLATPPTSIPAIVSANQTPGVVTSVIDNANSSIADTGAHSTNTVDTTNVNKTTVTNTNDVNIVSTNPQTASSGSSTVSNNVNAGSATTGTASNTSSNDESIDINN